jgi:hypothetical protein
LGERFLQRLGIDAEVRRRPYNAAISHDERLRGLVTHTKPSGDGVRDFAVCLNRYHRVARIGPLGGQMRQQLIKGFSADTARIAVFEKHQRSVTGFVEDVVELV